MKSKPKPAPEKPDPVMNGKSELLDEIEHVLFKARAARRPFVEYLLYMAFLEELDGSIMSKTAKTRKRAGGRAAR